MKLADKLLQYRKNHELTQKEFADKGGLTREAVQAIENGRVENPQMETLIGIAKAMETSIDELVAESEE
jgi:transcriptional regulator with XRE-family HTH domain